MTRDSGESNQCSPAAEPDTGVGRHPEEERRAEFGTPLVPKLGGKADFV